MPKVRKKLVRYLCFYQEFFLYLEIMDNNIVIIKLRREQKLTNVISDGISQRLSCL